MSSSSPSGKTGIKEYCALALMGALMFVLKIVLAALPNIHVGAVLVVLTAVFFGWRSMYSTAIYILLEGLIYGFSVWWVSYLYAWPLLTAVCVLLRKNRSAFLWAVVTGLFGLSFGALCAIPYLFIGGWEMAAAYWVGGIPFDLLHCAGNFVLTLVLYRPLVRAMSSAMKKQY